MQRANNNKKALGSGLWALAEVRCQRPEAFFRGLKPIPIRGQAAQGLKSSFTLAELMVAMVILIIILGITGAVYKSASDAITRTNSDVGINDDFNTLVRQVDTTLQNIVTDGYLVIYGWDVGAAASPNLEERTPDGKTVFKAGGTPDILPSVRSDAMCYFTTGSFQSLVTPNVRSNGGWVYLGHTGNITPATYGDNPFRNYATNPLVVNRWVLSRCLILLTPGQPLSAGADYCQTSIGNRTTDIAIKTSALTQPVIRTWFFNNWINDPAYWGTPPAIDFTNAAPITFPYTLPNCGSFRVEFAMPASFDNTPNTSHSNNEPEMRGGQIVWRDALYPTGTNVTSTTTNLLNAGTTGSGRTGDGMVVFGPTDPWPMFVRFTLRKYDETLTVTSDDPDTLTRHGGVTLQYVYKLPAKN